MPLLLLDLDNTLIDREAAFRSAAVDFLAEHGLPTADLSWLLAVDADGYRPRADVAAAVTARYGSRVPASAVRAMLDGGAADRVTLPAATRTALLAAADAGWTPVVVTNGTVAQQTAKIRRPGLDTLVDSWAVSAAVGYAKPAPEIFLAAAAGRSLRAACMIGDSAHADIGGAAALGLRSVWITRGRTWTEPAYAPTHTADDIVTALHHALAAPPDRPDTRHPERPGGPADSAPRRPE